MKTKNIYFKSLLLILLFATSCNVAHKHKNDSLRFKNIEIPAKSILFLPSKK